MSQITDLTLAQLKQALDDGDLSSVEITTAFLDRIDSLNPELNAFITMTHEDARKAAADADAARAKGKASAFAGLPSPIKICFVPMALGPLAAQKCWPTLLRPMMRMWSVVISKPD